MVQIFFEPTDKPFTDDWINDVEEYTDLKYYDPETDSKHPITELNKNI